MARCKAKNSKGAPCGAFAGKSSEYCFMHDPARGSEIAKARKKGGKRIRPGHRGEIEDVPTQVRSIDDVLAVLDYVLAEALPLENSVQRGRLIIAIANAYRETIKTGELESRLLAIENALSARKEKP